MIAMIILLLVICIFKSINNDSVVKELFIYAGYTYGPLLGMYAFGLFNKTQASFTRYRVGKLSVPSITIS